MLLVDAYRDSFIIERNFNMEELRILTPLDGIVYDPYIQVKICEYLDDSEFGGAGTEISYEIREQIYLVFSTGIIKNKPDDDLILDLALIWESDDEYVIK